MAVGLKIILLLSLALRFCSCEPHTHADVENNEFAEFEDISEGVVDNVAETSESFSSNSEASKTTEAHYACFISATGDDDDEFIQDDEEFEQTVKTTKDSNEPKAPQRLKFADVPAHFRSNWSSYQVEALFLLMVGLYMVNYIAGRSRNQSLAYRWFADVSSMLQEQFTIVGDDGTSDTPSEGHLLKETDSNIVKEELISCVGYFEARMCSGRVGCQSMLIQMKLVKRQDLISMLIGLIRPTTDKAIIRIDLDYNEMDSFVFAFGQRKAVTKAVKEMLDLSLFAVERKSPERLNLPTSMAVYAEMSEAITTIVDPTVQQVLRKYEKSLDYCHISDQYSGLKPAEGETYTRMPDTIKAIIFVINMSEDKNETKALMNTVFYCLEKVRRYRLSKDGKIKADKKRQSVHEAFMKTTHQARQEAAQARKEEKTRERKQRLLEEEDPGKQRKLEKAELKRESKLRLPKMKQLRMK
uniref:PAT complex subunit CCDC47 n=1 Tax=Syphacia muris TaxID=451379 RepID=A0A0N5AWT5_9BILA